MKFVPYLFFEGKAEEAMVFYEKVFDGKDVTIQRFEAMPPSDDMPPLPEAYKSKVMHGSMTVLGEPIYFSDTFPGRKINTGSNLEISLDLDKEETLRMIFDKLAEEGEVTMPVAEMFWGSVFGRVTDKYGFGWMLDYTPKGQ